jgi:hypothetical protein
MSDIGNDTRGRRESRTRRRIADGFIRVGLLLQVVFLVLVDWGTIAAVLEQPELPWLHLVGLVVVNLLLVPAAVVAWRWIPRSDVERSGARPPARRRALR